MAKLRELMTAITYHAVKPIYFALCVVAGIAVSIVPYVERNDLSFKDRSFFGLACVVAVVSVGFIPWMYWTCHHVSIRDEGIQVWLEYLFLLGPMVVISSGLGYFAGPLAPRAKRLPWVYVPVAVVLYLVSG